MPSQQSSFSGTRTAFTCHAPMAAIDAWSDGPSKMPQPCAQAYSVPERSTPSSRSGRPAAFTSWFPTTLTETLLAAAGGLETTAATRPAAATTTATNGAARRRFTSSDRRTISGT